MLTPLSTMTTGLPRNIPVVNRLPLMRQSRFFCVCSSSRSASAPKAETMPMRGLHSLRQRVFSACAVADTASKILPASSEQVNLFNKEERADKRFLSQREIDVALK